MQAQRGIPSPLRGVLPALSATVAAHQDRSCTALGALVCEEFGFFDVRGRKRRAGCMKALRVLEAEGHISLPEAQCDLRIAKPRLLEEPVPGATDVPADVRRIQDLDIVQVRNAEDRAVWNTLMDREHPQGAKTFAGAQMRYLIKSAHGYLGVAGFSAAALYLKPRDAWMAWSHEKRGSQLHRVVNLSRFLIRPGIDCKNLASYCLGRVLRRLASDFRERYDYAPYVVETFVGPKHEGTCFKAVGFQYLGLTQGRGRHAPNNPRPAVRGTLPARRSSHMHCSLTGESGWACRMWSFGPGWRWEPGFAATPGRSRSLERQSWEMFGAPPVWRGMPRWWQGPWANQ